MNNEVEIMDRALFDQVPYVVTMNILSRLPTKTSLNCKLVRKEWYQIIRSTEFAEHRSKNCPYSTIMLQPYSDQLIDDWLYGTKTDFSLLEIDDKTPFKVDEKGKLVTGVDNMVSFKPKLNIPFNEDLDFVNECNGLVLFLSSGRGESWVVCNLLTGEQVIVDQFHQPCSFPGDYVLGCCPVSNQFKVLRHFTMENVAEIKTLGTDEWRTVKTKSPIIKELGKGAFLHGSIHKGSSWENRIWSFHFGNEEFLDFPIPNKLEGHSRCLELTTFVLNSCLCIASRTFSNKECQIWMMKEYGVKDSWVQQYVFQTKKVYPCIPLLSLSTGEMLFKCITGVYLGEYHTNYRSWKKVKVGGASSFKVIDSYHVKFSKLSGIFF